MRHHRLLLPELRDAAPPEGRELRVLGKVELRAAEGKPSVIVGHAAVFNTAADIGGWYREQIAPGAFKASIGRDDVRALINHDPNLVLGRNVAGTLRLAEDDAGLAVEIDPPDTQAARDLMVMMKRGDVTQMSFGFVTEKQLWDDTKDPPLRTLMQVSLFDVSVVTFPAYPQTDAAARSALDAYRKEHKPVMAMLPSGLMDKLQFQRSV